MKRIFSETISEDSSTDDEDEDIDIMNHEQFSLKLVHLINKHYDPRFHSISSGILYTP